MKKVLFASTIAIIGMVGTAFADGDKVAVCHVTGSEKNPVVLISVSTSAVQAHLDHGDLLLPEGKTECPVGVPLPV